MTAEAEILQQRLLRTQNFDGGWGFQGKTSWTEPTAFALLALTAAGGGPGGSAAQRWLEEFQGSDGGWSPQPAVNQSTWVTSLATLALLQQGWRGAKRDRALDWLRGQVKRPEQPFSQFITRLLGQPVEFNPGYGVSWFPGTAAWIYPTAISVLLFLRLARLTGDQSLGNLARKGQEYMLSRRCGDGGWNHGGSRILSENAASYPEITGLALLALDGVPEPELAKSIDCGRRFLTAPASGEGLSWLQLGLAKHHVFVEASTPPFPLRTPREVALRLLALQANDARNFLVSPH